MTVDIEQVLLAMRTATGRAERYMSEDTDAANFCVVPNHTVSDMIDAFRAIDDFLSRDGFLPTDWAPIMTLTYVSDDRQIFFSAGREALAEYVKCGERWAFFGWLYEGRITSLSEALTMTGEYMEISA